LFIILLLCNFILECTEILAMADSRVVKKRLNDSYRCGYCRQHFIKLKDPRTLPCLHVYCMSCLKTDIGYRKTHIKCVYCG